MTSPQALVAEFHEKFGVPNNLGSFADVREDRLVLRADLIEEEFGELDAELTHSYLHGAGDATQIGKIAKEAADLVYVIYGMALEFGIDLDAVLAEVHRSNMTKTSENKRSDGKISKGPDYDEANIQGVLFG